MQNFTLKDLENLTGVKAHTLRIWEKRYGNIMPPTEQGKHRVYDNNDLKHILRITALYQTGLKISSIANMSAEEITERACAVAEKGNFEAFITRLIEFSVEMNEVMFKKLLSELRETLGSKNLYIHIVFPLLQRIGMLWMGGKIIPIQEHFCSNIIRNDLLLMIDAIPRKKQVDSKRILLFTPKSEFHEIPLLFCHFQLKMAKINVVYAGVNKSIGDIRDILDIHPCSHILTYMITSFLETDQTHFLETLSSTFPQHKIWAGGPSFQGVNVNKENITHLKSIEDLEESIVGFN